MAAVYVYDFTAFSAETAEDIIKKLSASCKKWAFQEEKCPSTAMLHFQGRMSLKVKCRIAGVITQFPGWHLSITTDANKNDFTYVCKEETRVGGPWLSEGLEPNGNYVPRQIRGKELRQWQQYIVNDADVWNDRIINVLIDPVGNIGKTFLATYLTVNKLGELLPYSNNYRDFMRMVMCLPKRKLYLFDLPRALRKDRLQEFFGGVETLKSGMAFDDRYKFKREIFDSPNIWIFMNADPDLAMLSEDRWRFWKVDEDMNMLPIVNV